MEPYVLITDLAGQPREWAPLEEGCCYHARKKVVFSMGEVVKVFHGGHNADGEQSLIEVQSILGCSGPLIGEKWLDRTSTYAERAILYARDRMLCAYCGTQYPGYKLTIDHVIPKSRGGKNTWTNCVAACKPCNHRKNNMTPEEAGMPLLYVPYVPSAQEKMILRNRNILADQMEWLMSRVPKTSRLWVDYSPLQ